jgi:hypothetical protein
MIYLNIVFAVIILVLLAILTKIEESYQKHVGNLIDLHHEHIENLTLSYKIERSELLDRIQAPTFGEYKNAEIKMVKAQKDEEPKPSFILE